MTFGMMKHLTRALLIGDNQLTTNEDEMQVLLLYAYQKVATESDAMLLWTNDPSKQILRSGPGHIYIRTPLLPESDSDELDIDEDLCPAVSRYIAAFVSRDRGGIHINEAKSIIRAYNQKVQSYMETIGQDIEIKEGYGGIQYRTDGTIVDTYDYSQYSNDKILGESNVE